MAATPGGGGPNERITFDADGNFSGFQKQAEEALRGVTKELLRLLAALDKINVKVGPQFDLGFKNQGNRIDSLNRDMEALGKTTRAFIDSTKSTGAPADIFATTTRQLERLTSLQRDFEADFQRLSKNPADLKAAQTYLDTLNRAFIQERTFVQSTLRDIESAKRASNTRIQRETDAAARERLATINRERGVAVSTIQTEGAQRTAETKIAGQRLIAQERATAQRRVEIFRFAANQIRALERALGSVFAGTATIVSGTVRRIEGAIGGLSRSLRRSNTDLNAGLNSSLTQRESAMSRSFTQQEQIVSRSMRRQQEAIQRQQATQQRFQAASQTGVAGVVTGNSLTGRTIAGLGLGVGAGVLGASLISGGLERYSNIERITKQFEALTGSAEEAAMLLEEVKAFAKETPFDLVGVADLAKGFIAIGTATEDILPRVRTIADAVALTGGNAENLVRIQRAIGQVVSAGRLQGDELNQLAENLPGLNIRQIIADQLTGGDIQAVVKMQEAGDLSADVFVDALLNGLASDPRLEGASEDLAKTLSGRLANLKESFQDFGASLIGLIAQPLAKVVQITQTALQGLSDFVKGEVNGALAVLRTAAIGAALAIGALLIARAAGEAIKFLYLALQTAISPFGALLLTVGLLGAAIAVLAKNSPEVRDALESVGETIRKVLAPAVEFVSDKISQFADFLSGTVLPAVEEFAIKVAEKVGPALEAIGQFITDKVIPAFEAFGEFIAEEVIPVFQAFGRFIADEVIPALGSFVSFITDTAVPAIGGALVTAFDAARSAIEAFWNFVEPIIRPAIEGFQTLGSAVADALTGDFSGLTEGLQALGSGIVESFKNLGSVLIDALSGPVNAVIDFLQDAFSGKNLEKVARGFLDLVEQIGFVLANVMTDRRVLTAIAAVAAAAVVIAARFLQGIARGIIDNLPDLLDAIWDLGTFLLKALGRVLLDNPQIIAVALATLLLTPRIIGAFRKAGTEGAFAYSKGFIPGLVSGFRNTRLFTDVLFGNEAGIRKAAERQGRIVARELGRVQQQVIALGGTPRFFDQWGKSFGNTKEAIEANRKEVEKLTTSLGPATSAALLAKDRISRSFQGLSTVWAGVRTGISGSFGEGFSLIKMGASQTATSMVESFRAGFANLKAAGISAGQVIGQAVMGAFGAVLSGQMLGSSTSGVGQAVGLAGILASSLAVGSISAPAGILTAVLGGLTAAITANKEAAKRAASEIREYADALGEATTASELMESATTVLLDNLGDENTGVREFLARQGFNAAEVSRQVLDGAFGTADALDIITAGFGSAGTEFRSLIDEFVAGGAKIDSDLISGLLTADTATSWSKEAVTATNNFLAALEAAGIEASTVSDTFDSLTDESSEMWAGLDDAKVNVALANLAGLNRETDEITSGFQRMGSSMDRPISQAEQFAEVMRRVNEGRTERLRREVELLTGVFDDARRAADDALIAATTFTTQTTAAATVDKAIIDGASIATEFQSAFERGGELGTAVMDTQIASLAAIAGENLRAAMEDGLVDPNDPNGGLFGAVVPIVQGWDQLVREELLTPAAREELGQRFNAIFRDQNFEVEVAEFTNLEAAADAAQTMLNERQFELQARINIQNLAEIQALLGVEPEVTLPRSPGADVGFDRGVGPVSVSKPSGVPVSIQIIEATSARKTATEVVSALNVASLRGGGGGASVGNLFQ